ncbi:MAG TPA: transketolase, partial [Anaeromyxobacteraceae bacterium]|nr:transketolase [Anaeromyxobacteraceae bacterium]
MNSNRFLDLNHGPRDLARFEGGISKVQNASPELTAKCVNTIRMLAVDAVQQANSGHPGLPMGAADMAFVLWTRHLRFDPKQPRWLGRDRFILSAGHGSMLLYALLHLTGYELTLDDLKSFRQLHSKTPGHPEFRHTPGVEVTSGPLGQGVANAVGFALGQAMLSAKLGAGNPSEDHFTYCLCSDGDLMEGVAAEAASFAGHNRLGRLVLLYDDNLVSLDGPTAMSFSEDVGRRFEAYGWHVQAVEEGRDHEAVSRALDAAKADPRPSLIRVRTVIGYGSPNRAGKSIAHGQPLGEEEVAATKKNLGWPQSPRFLVPDEVRAFFLDVVREKRAERERWEERAREWRSANRKQALLLDAHLERALPTDLREKLLEGADAGDATRKLSAAAIQKAAALVPCLVGGAADLSESNLTDIKGAGTVKAGSWEGRNIRYGVREHAMGAIANGLAYDGLFIPFSGTFLIFSDYMRPPVRLAALSRIQSIYVFTHDSIFLGEDGPTHQPIEQLTALRAIPNLHVVRPADGLETAHAWVHALERRDGPTAIALTRQKVEKLERSAAFSANDLARGGYLVRDAPKAALTIVATGSEVAISQRALALLAQRGIEARLVSMPCFACFQAQPADYREKVIPRTHRVVVVEASRGLEWWRLAGKDGLVIGIDGFGASAPEKALAEEYGFTPAKIAERIALWLA